MTVIKFTYKGKDFSVNLAPNKDSWGGHHRFKRDNPAIKVLKEAFPWAKWGGHSCWGTIWCWSDHRNDLPCGCEKDMGLNYTLSGPTRRQVAAVLIANGFASKDAERKFK